MSAIVRRLCHGDLAFAAECTAREGWAGETLPVFEGFFAHEPEGCLLAEEAGERSGICVATPYDGNGFIGELVVRREARGRGIGPRLLEAAIRYLRERGAENIYLDGVERAVPFYELAGFREVCRSLRFLGRPEIEPQGSGPTGFGPRPGAGPVAGGEGLRPMRRDDLPALFESDREAFGADRSFFLERRLDLHPEFAWVAEDAAGPAGFILGQMGNGLVSAGPWVVAERYPRPLGMLAPLGLAAGGLPLRIGVLETNETAVRALRALPGLVEKPPSRRMVLGPSGRLGNSARCWAVGSPAKG